MGPPQLRSLGLKFVRPSGGDEDHCSHPRVVGLDVSVGEQIADKWPKVEHQRPPQLTSGFFQTVLGEVCLQMTRVG